MRFGSARYFQLKYLLTWTLPLMFLTSGWICKHMSCMIVGLRPIIRHLKSHSQAIWMHQLILKSRWLLLTWKTVSRAIMFKKIIMKESTYIPICIDAATIFLFFKRHLRWTEETRAIIQLGEIDIHVDICESILNPSNFPSTNLTSTLTVCMSHNKSNTYSCHAPIYSSSFLGAVVSRVHE